MNILNKCYDIPDEKDTLVSRTNTLAPHFANLRGSTVQAMSNMLSANIDSGLMHSIGEFVTNFTRCSEHLAAICHARYVKYGE